MTKNKTTDLKKGESITTGVVRTSDLGYLLASVDELVAENVPFSRLYSVRGGKLGSMDVDWLACSATVCRIPEERLLVIAQKGGHILRTGGGARALESLSDAQKGSKRKPGLMREIRTIAAGRAYAVGTGRQAYRRETDGVWKCIDAWSQLDSRELVDYSFESIDGFSEKEIYTVGWKGEIWHYNGVKWTQVTSPTNLALHKVKCAGDGMAYIGGKGGVLIRGRERKWEIIDHEKTEEDIWGMEWFNEKLYASTLDLIYTLDGDDLEEVEYGEAEIPDTCYHLSSADGIMWSVGAHDVLQFDGKEWTRIV
jgi:hypothetical protein